MFILYLYTLGIQATPYQYHIADSTVSIQFFSTCLKISQIFRKNFYQRGHKYFPLSLDIIWSRHKDGVPASWWCEDTKQPHFPGDA